MPFLNITTNVPLDGVDTSSILSEATSSVASIIGKPEAYVMIVLKGSVPIAFGGTEQPAAYGELLSIGVLTLVRTRNLVLQLLQFWKPSCRCPSHGSS
ncbi:hypothetical protein Fmac_012122 [Flemingia macrophylla]|uniref:Macrophage migration inhibitory factor n=1 Tax=Flemingia macrophylla TaxID=520843 RepID=A0ABD1MPE8_9FABA